MSGRLHTPTALLPKKQRPVPTADLNDPRQKKKKLPLPVFEPRIPLSSNPCPSHHTDYIAHIHTYRDMSLLVIISAGSTPQTILSILSLYSLQQLQSYWAPQAHIPYVKFVNVISQMNHQLDATLCRFYFCRVTLNVSGASAHHQEYLKTSTVATGTCVIVARQSEFLKKLVLTKVIVFKVLKC